MGAGKKCLEKVEEYLKSKNEAYTVLVLSRPGEGITIAESLCKGGAEKIAVIGGDGTFHEVLNGMDFSKCRMALIPAGRGNDYASGAGLTFDPIKAIEAVVQNRIIDRDYIQIGKRRCLNVAGTGLDIEVLRLTEKFKTKLSYNASLVRCLLNYKPYEVKIEVNGTEKTYSCIMAAVCNGNQFGGGIKLCPPAKNDDGKMNLIIVKQPRVPTLMVMPVFVSGNHMNKSWVEHITCESAKITCLTSSSVELDGEIYEDGQMDAHIVKGGFKTFES